VVKARISTDEIWKSMEERRQERLDEPYLIAFRAMPEEIEMRRVEDADETKLQEEPFTRWARKIARCGREGVRFEFYLTRQGFYPDFPEEDSSGYKRKDK
jgi:hypothetical protein